MLRETNLFETVDKVKIAIARLKEYEPPEGYYLAFSGGKDSIVVHHLAERAGVKFTAHYNHTTVDPPELIYYMRKHYPSVIVRKPKLSMWKLIVKKKMPPTRLVRYCCEILKEGGGAGRFVLTGVRWQESVKRSKRRLVEACIKGPAKRFLHPIIDWTSDEVWEYIHANKMPYCSLYDEGFKRIGCIMCPAARRRMKMEMKRYPTYYRAYLHAFGKMLDSYTPERRAELSWKTAQEVMDWWINPKDKVYNNPDQTVLFE